MTPPHPGLTPGLADQVCGFIRSGGFPPVAAAAVAPVLGTAWKRVRVTQPIRAEGAGIWLAPGDNRPGAQAGGM